MGNEPAWVTPTAQAAAEMEKSAGTFLADTTVVVARVDRHDAEAVVRLARGIRRKMEAWRRRSAPRTG